MKNNMIRATRASMDSTILYWPRNFIELLFLNEWAWTLGILGSGLKMEMGLPPRTTHPNCPTCHHPSQHHEMGRPPWRRETQMRCWGWWVGLSQVKVTTFGTNEHHERAQWLQWITMAWYSIPILLWSSSTLCFLVLVCSLWCASDLPKCVLRHMRGKYKVYKQCKAHFLRFTSSPCSFQQVAAEKFEQIPVKSQFDHVLISIPFHFYIWILKGHETRWSSCKLPVAPCTLLSSSPSPSSPSANRVTGEDLAGPNTNRTKLKSWTNATSWSHFCVYDAGCHFFVILIYHLIKS